ncbi:MAG: carbohydrate kinase family protein [Deltaproteobacteria bacterium]|nr:MAG: carbohydrate kinase family protein [Deltaproteobacteria bacterium]
MSDAPRADRLWPESRAARSLDVLGIGQNSYDHVAELEAFPRFAGKAAARRYETLPGGQVATALLGCARLGLRGAFVSTVGDDAPGEAVLRPLRAAGVDVSGVRRIPGAKTQIALILIDRASGERTVVWYRDPRLALEVRDLSRASIERARVLHLDASDPEVACWAADVAREAGIPVVLDADRYRPELDAILRRVDFPIVGLEFAETYTSGGSVTDALVGLSGAGARLAVVTLGPIGALARQGERRIESPAFRVEARDTTGAGDAFHAGFIWALLQGLDAERALRIANAAGALCCREIGAQGGQPDRDALEAFLRAHEPIAWTGP